MCNDIICVINKREEIFVPEETKTAETWQNSAKSFDSTKTPLPGGALVLHTAEELKIFVNPE